MPSFQPGWGLSRLDSTPDAITSVEGLARICDCGAYRLATLRAIGVGLANFVTSIGTFARTSLSSMVERPSVQVTIQR